MAFRRSALITAAAAVRTVISRMARPRCRSAAAWIALVTRIARFTWTTWLTAVLSSIRFSDPIWEESREAGADWIILGRNFCKATGEGAQLNWYNDFLFCTYTQSNDQIAVYFSFRAHAEIPAAAVGCQTGFSSYIGKLGKPWEEGRIRSAWHTDFKEIGQNQRMSFRSHIYLCANGEHAFIITSVT